VVSQDTFGTMGQHAPWEKSVVIQFFVLFSFLRQGLVM
jgi:hypothetical protein